jgi:hypothetical protein
MKITIALLALFANLPASAANSYLHCQDDQIELVLEADSDIEEIGSTSGRDLFSKKNVLKIKTAEQTYIFNQNVIVASDGFGNDAVQVFAQDPFGPLVPVIQFTYEHEGSYLDGFYSLPKDNINPAVLFHTENFQTPIQFYADKMKCNFALN